MILAIDIGNTNIVLGAVTDGNIDFMARMSTDKLKTEDEYSAQILSIMNLYHILKRLLLVLLVKSLWLLDRG